MEEGKSPTPMISLGKIEANVMRFG